MKLGSIQFLRALAVLLVVYAHSIDLQMAFSHSFQQDFYYWQNFGAFGVDIFFVISGFIISYTARSYQGAWEGVQFLFKRFKRLNPVYYLATLLFTGLYIHAMLVKMIPFYSVPVILKSIFLLPLFDTNDFTPTILPPAWTLSFEWFFYLLFFLTILVRTRYKEAMLLLLLTGLVLTGFFFTGLRDADYRLRFMMTPILLEFLLGVGLYWCYRTIKIPAGLALLLLLTGTGICLVEIFHGFGEIPEAGNLFDVNMSFTRVVLWGIPAGLLVAGCIFLEKARRGQALWNNKLIALLGDASYSIYLVNVTVYGGCSAVYHRAGFFLNPDLAIVIQALLAIIGGVVFYKVAEAPLLRLLRPRKVSGLTQDIRQRLT